MKLSVTFSPQTISVQATAPAISVKTADQIAKVYLERDPYLGPYTVAPGEEPVTLATDALRMTDDVVVQPVPPNYARMAWNGSTITFY